MKLSRSRVAHGEASKFRPPSLDASRSFALLFGAPECREDAEAIAAALGIKTCIGCSTSGEIFGGELTDRTVVVATVELEHGRARAHSLPIHGPDASRAAGQTLADALVEDDLVALFILSDGLLVNGSELASGLSSRVPPHVVVTGGLAGDGPRFKSTWVLADGAAVSGRVAAVALYGSRLDVRYGSRGGWDIFGPDRVVTRAEGNVVFELDGKPVLDLYESYLGERAAALPASGLLFPLSIHPPEDPQRKVVRTLLGVDTVRRSLTFAGDVPVGWRARLMCANFDRLVQGAADAALACDKADADRPTLVLAVSCVGRRLVLGERSEEETEATCDFFGPAASQVGFYSYGELSPLADGTCGLHNQTMTLTTIAER